MTIEELREIRRRDEKSALGGMTLIVPDRHNLLSLVDELAWVIAHVIDYGQEGLSQSDRDRLVKGNRVARDIVAEGTDV